MKCIQIIYWLDVYTFNVDPTLFIYYPHGEDDIPRLGDIMTHAFRYRPEIKYITLVEEITPTMSCTNALVIKGRNLL